MRTIVMTLLAFALLLYIAVAGQPRHSSASAETTRKPPGQLAEAPATDFDTFFKYASPAITGIVGGGVFSAAFAYVNLRLTRRRDCRETLFKCLDAYNKVMDYKAKTRAEHTYDAYLDYYRALFDLHWTEYQMWMEDAVKPKHYRAWLNARKMSYLAPATTVLVNHVATPISYRIVWDCLLQNGYFERSDPFVGHMELVHAGRIEEALGKEK